MMDSSCHHDGFIYTPRWVGLNDVKDNEKERGPCRIAEGPLLYYTKGKGLDDLLEFGDVLGDHLVGNLVVLKVAGEILVVGAHVKETMAAEVE